MKKTLALVSLTVLVTLAVVAVPASADKGRRLAGPFCINNNTGVVRAIAVKQSCVKGETRKLGVAIPCPTLTYAKGHTCIAEKGKTGAPGKDGKNGAPGSAGVAGPGGATGLQGPVGPTGAAGAKGETGAKGDKGDKGDSGVGVGDGYRWLCEDGGQGNGLADGGTGVEPECNGGTKLAFKVVTVGVPIEYHDN